MFWNGKTKISWDDGLRLSDVAQGIDVIFLVETWEHEVAKCVSKIKGYLFKNQYGLASKRISRM